MFGSFASEGDWIALRRQVSVSMVDSFTGCGLKRGTRGVVVSRIGSQLQVSFDSGLGTVHATVRARDTRVVRRRGGVERFEQRTNITAAIRSGVILAFAAPFIVFIWQYIWVHHTTDGLFSALLSGLIQGVLDTITMAIKHPVPSLLYLAVTTVLWRWAWRF